MFVDNWFDDMSRVSQFKIKKYDNDFGLEKSLAIPKKQKIKYSLKVSFTHTTSTLATISR